MYHYPPLIFVFLVETAFRHPGQAGLELLTSGDPPTSASQSAEITEARHHPPLIFVFLVETGFHHFVQAGLELLSSGNLLNSASQNARITSVSHHAQTVFVNLLLKFLNNSKSLLGLFFFHPSGNLLPTLNLNSFYHKFTV